MMRRNTARMFYTSMKTCENVSHVVKTQKIIGNVVKKCGHISKSLFIHSLR